MRSKKEYFVSVQNLILLVFLMIILIAIWCEKPLDKGPSNIVRSSMDEEEVWWSFFEPENVYVLENFELGPDCSIDLGFSGYTDGYYGVLVSSYSGRKSVRNSLENEARVSLTQKDTNLFIETTYSAARRFELSKGNQFSVKNHSEFAVKVVVFKDERSGKK